jgi:hypothetical protein
MRAKLQSIHLWEEPRNHAQPDQNLRQLFSLDFEVQEERAIESVLGEPMSNPWLLKKGLFPFDLQDPDICSPFGKNQNILVRRWVLTFVQLWPETKRQAHFHLRQV